MPTLYQIMFVALVATFIILFSVKIGLRDYIIENSPIKIISKMFDCDFCLSFWVAVILCTIALIFTKDISYIFVPICSTPITRFIL